MTATRQLAYNDKPGQTNFDSHSNLNEGIDSFYESCNLVWFDFCDEKTMNVMFK